jgi:hypothetical protein
MKDIKKSASFTSKKKGKDVKFNIDLNYSPEYDSFIIKVKEGEGFMAYSSNIERMPLEVIQKLNEMLEEVLIKAGSEYEMKEHKMFNGVKVDSKLTESEVEKIAKETAKALGSKFSVTEGTIDNGSFDLDYDGVKYDGGSYIVLEDGDVKNVAMPKKPIVYNYKTKKKYEFGGDFQSGVYANGGYFDGSIPEVSTYMTNYDKGGALKNERLHVNKDEDYEVRYSKPRPHRKGYKGLRNFDGGGGVNVGYNVFNYTDDIYATDEVFKTKTLANKFIKEFRNRFVNQGYYRDNRMNKINIEDIDLLAIPSDFNPYKKYATGGGVGLIGNQKRIDMNKNGKIDAEDFKLLRSSMNGAWRNERKHVNQTNPKEDYEVRYAKSRPSRTGYKGKRNFEGGGKMQKAESGTEVKKGVKGGIMTLAKKIRKEGESWQDAVKRAGQQLK